MHTANKTLTSNVATDGGLYLPRNMPHFSQDEISELMNSSFTETFSTLLNCFYSAELTGWDVDFAIGRNPVKVLPIGRKILIAQSWRNPEHRYAYIENNIFKKLSKQETESAPTQWPRISVRIALLFSICGQLLQSGYISSKQLLDIAVDADDPIDLMAVFYARQMGLPIGRLICGCDTTGDLWDFIHLGEINAGSAPVSLLHTLERMIHITIGAEEVTRFLHVCKTNGTYHIPETDGVNLSDILFCAVVGKNRVADIINSAYRTDGCFLDSGTARSYGAVQDYRAKTGTSSLTLLISNIHPAFETNLISNATGLSQSTFFEKCKII